MRAFVLHVLSLKACLTKAILLLTSHHTITYYYYYYSILLPLIPHQCNFALTLDFRTETELVWKATLLTPDTKTFGVPANSSGHSAGIRCAPDQLHIDRPIHAARFTMFHSTLSSFSFFQNFPKIFQRYLSSRLKLPRQYAL